MTIVRVADLRQQVYETLKAQIISGRFSRDTRFYEIPLAEELGVSRTPVREALTMLVRDGLLAQAKRGFVFPNLSARDIIDIIDVRLQLEPYAMRRIVERTEPEERHKLSQLMQKEISEHHVSIDYINAHARMRAALLKHVGNQVLVDTIQQFEDSIHLIRFATLKSADTRQKSCEGNLQLAQAISIGDADAAEKAQRTLLEVSRDAFLTHLAMID